MALEKYNQKRDFKQTPEPSGKKADKKSKQLLFVIQKHEASHLHFDFRIEVNGVMKSWAVPKGVSLDTKTRRLAMEVEDHPMDYRNFEGTIPEGNYGAGTVMVWDEGYYEPVFEEEGKSQEEMVMKGYKKGDLKIRIFGKKIKGEFALVRIKNNKYSSKNNSWLLIKHKDDYANTSIENENLSVKTGRTMEEIADNKKSNKDIKWTDVGMDNNVGTTLGLSLQKSTIPTSVQPMLGTLSTEPFSNSDWIYEIKWDGYRALAQIENGKVRLYSRNDQDFNDDYPEVVEELKKYKGKMILDGEIVAVDDKGIPKFQWLQDYAQSTEHKLIYYVFDILYFDQFDLRNFPLTERQKILKEVIKENEFVRLSTTYDDGEKLFESAKNLGLEGVMAKKRNSSYESGRSHNWLKIKTVNEREFVIGGYTYPKGNRKGFGSILVGEYDKDKFIYRGNVGTGFNDKIIRDLKARMDKLERKTSPFEESDFILYRTVEKWVKPELVAQIKFTEWTNDNMLRHPVYLGLRKDKEAKDVKVEVKVEPEENIYDKVEATHLDKVYWPESGYTKKDLLEYYNEISEVMLPYLIDRPQNLNRHPHGINGNSFYQKDYDQSHPDFVKTIPIFSESKQKENDYLLCQNKETLLFLANLGCIEINPWNSRINTLDNPDYVLFDLDPENTDFKNVVKVAQELHKLFEEIKIPNFCKTSGKRGLHVYIPLKPRYNFEQVRLFAELIAVRIRNKMEDIVSLERSPKDRQGKVYIDYLQNRKGQTTAGVYSVRPVEPASVSTPLLWDEVNSKLNPKKFTIKTVPKRIKKLGDLWTGMREESADIEKALKSIL